MAEEKREIPEAMHLVGVWTGSEAIEAGDQVRAMMETPGWKRFLESIEIRLRSEQRTMMVSPPRTPEDNERTIGRWNGLASVPKLAEGIVRNAEKAAAEARAA
jgi:hypothetical protein